LPYLELALPATEFTTPASLSFVPLDDSLDITDRFTCPNFLTAVREVTNVPYPNPVLVSDVSGIRWLSLLEDRGITSFDGIEYFAMLESLHVGRSSANTLDVSNNLALVSLIITDGSLITLDVSNNLALESLTITGGLLTTLDVSNNPALRILEVPGNQLTSLDVSNNPALYSLIVDGIGASSWNQLTSFRCVQQSCTYSIPCKQQSTNGVRFIK